MFYKKIIIAKSALCKTLKQKLISCTLCNFPGVLSCFSGTELFASDKQKVSVQLHTLPNYIDSQIGIV